MKAQLKSWAFLRWQALQAESVLSRLVGSW